MPDWTHYSAKSKKKGKKEKIGKKGENIKYFQQYIRKDTQRNIKSFNSIHYLAPALNVSWDEDPGRPRFKLILMHTAFSGAATLTTSLTTIASLPILKMADHESEEARKAKVLAARKKVIILSAMVLFSNAFLRF